MSRSISRPRPRRPTPACSDWVTDYPRQFGGFRDSDGRKPRHTFFFPAEEYEPEYLDALTDLCAAGHGEVEIHLHHDRDTAEGLRQKLLEFKEVLASRHGLLARRRDTGEPVYAFIHGNWALCNSHPDGRHCGVNNELTVLRETGCYADLTMPSAPSPTQTPTINNLYYARDIPAAAGLACLRHTGRHGRTTCGGAAADSGAAAARLGAAQVGDVSEGGERLSARIAAARRGACRCGCGRGCRPRGARTGSS